MNPTNQSPDLSEEQRFLRGKLWLLIAALPTSFAGVLLALASMQIFNDSKLHISVSECSCSITASCKAAIGMGISMFLLLTGWWFSVSWLTKRLPESISIPNKKTLACLGGCGVVAFAILFILVAVIKPVD